MKKFFCFLIFQFLIGIATFGQNCLKLSTPNDGENVNPDFHMIDSCESSQNYNKLFVKNGILIRMNEYVFTRNPLPLDTFVTISAIDTSFDSVISAFYDIQSKFGDFTIRRANLFTSDSEFVNNPILILDFDTYNLFDSIAINLYNVPNVILVTVANTPNKMFYVPTQYNEMKPNTDIATLLWDNPTGGGFWISTNDGINWVQRNTGISNYDISVIKKIGTTIYMGTHSGKVYQSTNDGIGWTEIGRGAISGQIRFNSIIEVGSDIYFATFDQGLLKLTGSALQKVTGPASNYITCITKKANDEYYIGYSDQKPPKSIQKWTPTAVNAFVDFFDGPSQDVEIGINSIALTGQTIIAGTLNDYIYKKTGSGVWEQKKYVFDNKHINCLAVTNTGKVLAGTNAGVYKSDNTGDDWYVINNTQLQNTKINAISVNGSDIYLGTESYGIFKSTDEGSSWTQINGTITCRNVKTIDNSGSNVYIGTWGLYDKIRPDLHKLGLNWNLFTLQCPMAWEITKGRKEGDNKVVLANQLSGSEYFGDTQKDMYYSDWNYYHSDVKTNYIYPDIEENRYADGLISTFPNFKRFEIANRLYPMSKWHGLWVLSMAITAMDNGPNNNMVGTAPNVNGVSIFGFPMWDMDLEKWPIGDLKTAFEAHNEQQAYRCDAYDFDVDTQKDDLITMPDVLNTSEGNDGERGQVIAHGIAMFTCAGNWAEKPFLRYDPNSGKRWWNDNTYLAYPDSAKAHINPPFPL